MAIANVVIAASAMMACWRVVICRSKSERSEMIMSNMMVVMVIVCSQLLRTVLSMGWWT